MSAPKKNNIYMVLRRDDFSQSALDLGIWNELTRDIEPEPEYVEVLGKRWAS